MLTRAVTHLRVLAHQLRIDELNRYSAEAAFYMLRSAIPLLALSLGVVGRFVPVQRWLTEIAAAELLPNDVLLAVGRAAERLLSGPSFATFLSIGAALTLWSAAVGMRALCRATVRLTGGVRPSYATAVFRGILGALLFSAVLALLLLLFQLWGKTGGILLALPLLFFFCVCLTKIFLRQRAKGLLLYLRALFTSFTWEGFSLLFGLYLSTVPRASYLYGGIGALLLFMIYVRACLWIFLFPFALTGRSHRWPTMPPKAPDALPRPSRRAADETWRSKDPMRPWRS